MPFNPSQGEAKMESKLKRALLAFPFLALFYLFKTVMDVTPAVPALENIMKSGKVTWNTGSAPILYEFYHIKFIDDLYATLLFRHFVPLTDISDLLLSTSSSLQPSTDMMQFLDNKPEASSPTLE
jgi:hypothetical protein